jgi:hypothetical protein
VTNPAAGTKSIGLPADALAVMVFAEPLREFYRDGTASFRLPGLNYLDNFIWTRILASINRDFAKTHASPDTDGNSLNRRAIRFHLIARFQLNNILLERFWIFWIY